MVKIACILLLIVVLGTATVGLLMRATSIRVQKGTSSYMPRRLTDIPADKWTQLGEKTIFFGHRSVGTDIINGIEDLAGRHGFLTVNLLKTRDVNDVKGPMLAHASIGRNQYPELKVEDFKTLMESGLAEKVDIAFFKFCFVDIVQTSDPNAIFATYCEAMDSLKSRFPDVTFVHVTVPLCGPPKKFKGALKATVKRVIGGPPVLDENLVRARYNDLMRERFSGKEPLFDLALYETLEPWGQRHYSLKDGQEIPILARAYTDDGGHLNTVGRQHLAEQLLIELQDLAGRTP